MPDPTHAVVTAGTVTTVVLMDTAVAQQFRDLGFVEQLWPGGELIDVTDADPMPGVGWTYHPDTTHPWRPLQPSPDAAWDDDTGTWVVPEPVDEPAA